MLEAQGLFMGNRLINLSAALRPGEVTAICGPNGAGKSTLLGCLAGLYRCSAGVVRLDGAPLTTLPPRIRARALGYLPQSPEVAWDVTVEVLVGLGRLPWQVAPLHRSHTTPAQDTVVVEDAIAAMDLAALRHRTVSRLSGGERARALVARVLAGQPRWLLADEPLANLDLGHAATLVARLKQQAAAGVGVVLVLHDLATAMNHADRVLVIDRGALVADGPPATALAEATIARVWGVTARWLGDRSEMALSLNRRGRA
jgi:iron complex transport system ATP-binding protein